MATNCSIIKLIQHNGRGEPFAEKATNRNVNHEQAMIQGAHDASYVRASLVPKVAKVGAIEWAIEDQLRPPPYCCKGQAMLPRHVLTTIFFLTPAIPVSRRLRDNTY